MKAICTALLITAAMPAAASAAKFTTVADACGDGCTIIAIIGSIESYDDITFNYLIRNQKIDKAIVHLDSPGGSVYALLRIGAEIHNAGFWTYVPPGARCTSACADIWLAGKKRFLAADALLGFHSTAQTLGGMRMPSATGDAIVQRYYRMLGLRDDTIDYFFAESTFDISYVTIPKLKQLGIDCDLAPPKMIAEAPKPIEQRPIEPKLCETVVPKSRSDAQSLEIGTTLDHPHPPEIFTLPGIFTNTECTELKAAPNLTVERASKHERGK